jgi:uncharacterized membrane protein YphA (DoxX/SURF4 family)
MTRAWRAWERFWFEPRSVAPLVLIRIAFGILVFLWAVSVLPDAKTFFGPDGVLTDPPSRDGAWSVLHVWDSSTAAVVLVVLLGVGGLLLVVGLWSRMAAAVVFVAFVSLSNRNGFVGNSGDALLRVLSLYVLLAPVGAAFSLDALRRGQSLLDFPQKPGWALRLIQIQLSLIYIGTVWAKLRGTTWPDGDAVAYAFRLDDLARFPVPDVGDSLLITHVLTYGVLVLETALGVLVWVPRLRPWVLLGGVCLHLGIEYRLRVGFFSWAILTTYLAFVSGATAERMLGWAARLRSRRWLRSGSMP